MQGDAACRAAWVRGSGEHVGSGDGEKRKRRRVKESVIDHLCCGAFTDNDLEPQNTPPTNTSPHPPPSPYLQRPNNPHPSDANTHPVWSRSLLRRLRGGGLRVGPTARWLRAAVSV